MYRGHRIWKQSHGSCVYKVKGGSMSTRWFPGHRLGRKSGTEEHVLMTEEGPVCARTSNSGD